MVPGTRIVLRGQLPELVHVDVSESGTSTGHANVTTSTKPPKTHEDKNLRPEDEVRLALIVMAAVGVSSLLRAGQCRRAARPWFR
jgi:hypothetical protein